MQFCLGDVAALPFRSWVGRCTGQDAKALKGTGSLVVMLLGTRGTPVEEETVIKPGGDTRQGRARWRAEQWEKIRGMGQIPRGRAKACHMDAV